MTKTCASCRRELPLTEFRRHRGHGDGYDSRCKECMRRDAAAKKKLRQPSIAQVEPKRGHQLAANVRVMTDPYLALRNHQRQCRFGCEKDEPLIEAAALAFELFFNTYTEDDLGGLPEHGKAWVREALRYKRLLLNVPPRHAKTTIMAKWFVIWQLACDRDVQVILISKTIVLGELISRYIADQLETNEKLIADFGRFRPKDLTRPWRIAKGELEVEGKDLTRRHGLSVQIRGSGQQILGMEADWVIADDITDRKVAKSDADRTTEWDFFLGDVLTRLAPDGKAFCIGQRVHSEDLYGRLAKQKDEVTGELAWFQIRTPAILDEEEELALWPAVWPVWRLQDTRKAIGGPLFQCMYQQAPEYAGEYVPAWWLTGDGTSEHPGCFDHRVLGQGWKPDDSALAFVPVTRVMSVDPSPTNFAGIVVADIVWLPQSRFFYAAVLDIERGRFGQNLLMTTLFELQKKYQAQVLILETNSAKWLHEDPAWHRLTGMYAQQPIGQNTTRWNKNDTELGIWSLASDFEAGRIQFPMGNHESREKMQPLIDEILAYPNGNTDDVLMALWFIKANYKLLMPRNLMPTTFRGAGMGLSGRSWDQAQSKRRWEAHQKNRAPSHAKVNVSAHS